MLCGDLVTATPVRAEYEPAGGAFAERVHAEPFRAGEGMRAASGGPVTIDDATAVVAERSRVVERFV